MAPLPQNSTKRYWLDYNVDGERHSLLCRTLDDVVDADAAATIAAFLTAVAPAIHAITVEGFRVSDSGSNVSSPITWPGATVYGSGAGSHASSAVYVRFVGRDFQGKRVSVGLFGGINVTVGGDYRVAEGEADFVGDSLAELESDAGIFITINGASAVWKRYANIGVNAYWRDKIR